MDFQVTPQKSAFNYDYRGAARLKHLCFIPFYKSKFNSIIGNQKRRVSVIEMCPESMYDENRKHYGRAVQSPVIIWNQIRLFMENKLVIRAIRPEEVAEARRLIYLVAHDLMEPQMSLEEVTAQWDTWDVFCDLDNVQKSYFEDGGMFLVMVDGGQLVGTGAFHRLSDEVCELRRLAFLPEYRGRGLGYAMMMELLRQAQAVSYEKMCLWTDRYKLTRAVAFYHQLGFVDVPHEGADEEELWMEMPISRLISN